MASLRPVSNEPGPGNELVALYFSRNLILSPGKSPFRAELESAFKKIESAVAAKRIARLEKIEEMFIPLVKASKKTHLTKGHWGRTFKIRLSKTG